MIYIPNHSRKRTNPTTRRHRENPVGQERAQRALVTRVQRNLGVRSNHGVKKERKGYFLVHRIWICNFSSSVTNRTEFFPLDGEMYDTQFLLVVLLVLQHTMLYTLDLHPPPPSFQRKDHRHSNTLQSILPVELGFYVLPYLIHA